MSDRTLALCRRGTYSLVDNANGAAPRKRPAPGHEESGLPMSTAAYKRHKTRHPGVYYRLRADGKTKSYCVHHGGRFVAAGTTEKEALALQADLRGRKARGERVVVNDRTTFAELAEQWLEAKSNSGKRPLRRRTVEYYRTTLDTVLLPRFGSWRLRAIDAEAISRLVRDLEREGLHAINAKRPVRPLGRSSIENYLKPLQGVLKLAVRRRLIPDNPFGHLTDDDRPRAGEKREPHEWSTDGLETLFAAAERLAAKPESRYDYTPLLRLTARLGLRLGEVLGLQWQDFDKDEGFLHVRRQWTRRSEYGPTKTSAGARDIALPAELRKELIDLRLASAFSQDEHPIFASREGTPLAHRNVTRRGFEMASQAAGLDGVSFHDLRHAAASRLIAAGVDPVTVAAVLGHEDANVTLKVYAHQFNRQRRDDAVREALSASL
jgi:integrase